MARQDNHIGLKLMQETLKCARDYSHDLKSLADVVRCALLRVVVIRQTFVLRVFSERPVLCAHVRLYMLTTQQLMLAS
jgi:hypothetical protein